MLVAVDQSHGASTAVLPLEPYPGHHDSARVAPLIALPVIIARLGAGAIARFAIPPGGPCRQLRAQARAQEHGYQPSEAALSSIVCRQRPLSRCSTGSTMGSRSSHQRGPSASPGRGPMRLSAFRTIPSSRSAPTRASPPTSAAHSKSAWTRIFASSLTRSWTRTMMMSSTPRAGPTSSSPARSISAPDCLTTPSRVTICTHGHIQTLLALFASEPYSNASAKVAELRKRRSLRNIYIYISLYQPMLTPS